LSLSDELAAEELSPGCCLVSRWIDQQNEDDREAFDGWVKAGKSWRALHRACIRSGYPGGWWAFHNHLRCHVSHVSE
jgi:hypothetical protein